MVRSMASLAAQGSRSPWFCASGVAKPNSRRGNLDASCAGDRNRDVLANVPVLVAI